MKRQAKRVLLPCLEVTEIALPTDENAIPVYLREGNPNPDYYVRNKHENPTGERIDFKPRWMGSRFNLFPLVLDALGVPWAEANVYLLSRAESTPTPVMSTLASIADSLASFRRFIDETGIDWTEFPTQKLKRPTYRYSSYLRLEIANDRLKDSTAKRHMSTVISFYSWLIQENTLKPAHSPWKKDDRFIQLTDRRGLKFSKQISTTDLSIRTAKSNDPYSDQIEDGGKLRPLNTADQEYLIEALIELGNTEMLLIHLIGLLTGARIQTVLTIRLKHVSAELNNVTSDEIRIPAGPGTGIDTKYGKKIVLHFPKWLYEKLHIYANSNRSKLRRSRAEKGDNADQYLFLSIRGVPLYTSKLDSLMFDSSKNKRHIKNGQAVRQFIKDYVIPLIRLKKNDDNFQYHFHDTRASYGMNLTDHQLKRVSLGEITLHQAREFVKARMGHESSATTDKYLQYRSNLHMASAINTTYQNHIQNLIGKYTIGKNEN